MRRYNTNTCEKLNTKKSNIFWKDVHRLTQYKSSPSVQRLNYNNMPSFSDLDRARVFASYFQQPQNLNHPRFDQDHFQNVTEWYNTFDFNLPIDDNTITIIDSDDYFQIIHSGKNTAPGYDHTSRKVLKELDDTIHNVILKILNHFLANGIFPDVWKQGITITIPKPNKNLTHPSSYRPITLLPVIGKIYEKLLNERLQHHLEEFIPKYQFGFRRNTSTIVPLSILVSNVQNSRLNGHHSAAVFLDINKAFDSVWHAGLLYKLH